MVPWVHISDITSYRTQICISSVVAPFLEIWVRRKRERVLFSDTAWVPWHTGNTYLCIKDIKKCILHDGTPLGPIPNHTLHPTPTHYPSVCAFATLSAVPNQRVWRGSGLSSPQTVSLHRCWLETGLYLTGVTLCVSVRKHAVYNQFQQTSTDTLRC